MNRFFAPATDAMMAKVVMMPSNPPKTTLLIYSALVPPWSSLDPGSRGASAPADAEALAAFASWFACVCFCLWCESSWVRERATQSNGTWRVQRPSASKTRFIVF